MNHHDVLPGEGNEPYDTLAEILAMVLAMVRGLLAAIGLIACAAVVGLYFGGFFHHVAGKFPQGVVAFVLGVSV